MQTTACVYVMQWIRRFLLVEGTPLYRFQTKDRRFLVALLDYLKGESALPTHCIVEQIINDLVCCPAEVPYMLDHCHHEDKWIGIDVFMSRDEAVRKVSDAFKKYERRNCEMIWQSKLVGRRDSAIMEEDQASLKPGQKGW